MKEERCWTLGFAALVMAATCLPYLAGYARAGDDWMFSGFVFGVEDGNSYIAKMASGAAGAWLFRTPYTIAPQRGVLAFLPYLLLGKLAAPPAQHVQLVVLFHLFRLGAGVLAILATDDFLAFFLRDGRPRRWALALATLGGGLGWILVLAGQGSWLGSLPLEFYSPETFGFLGLYGLPHLALARATLLWGLLAYLRAARAARRAPGQGLRWRAAVKIGLLWLLVALSQPLSAVVFGVVIGLYLLAAGVWNAARTLWARKAPPGGVRSWRGNWLRGWIGCLRLASASALIPAPFILYNFLTFQLDPFLRAWTGQNRILSPHPLHYLLAYGLLLPFAANGARRLMRRPWEGAVLVAWVLALPALAYLPFNLQRRLPEGTWVALVVLAAAGSKRSRGLGDRRPAAPALPLAAVQALAFPSTLLLLAGGVLAAWRPAQPVFRPAQEVAAFQSLQEQADPGEAVLSAYETGNALPAWAPLRVVIGHGPESAGLAGLQPRVADFYRAGTSNSERLAFLRAVDAAYVFWGPAERALGDWDPGQADYLAPLDLPGPYQVYRAILPPE